MNQQLNRVEKRKRDLGNVLSSSWRFAPEFLPPCLKPCPGAFLDLLHDFQSDPDRIHEWQPKLLGLEFLVLHVTAVFKVHRFFPPTSWQMPHVYQHRGRSLFRAGWWCTCGMATTLNKYPVGSRGKPEAARGFLQGFFCKNRTGEDLSEAHP